MNLMQDVTPILIGVLIGYSLCMIMFGGSKKNGIRLRYTPSVGEAGQQYLDDLRRANGLRPRSDTFRWSTLFMILVRAAGGEVVDE